MSGAGMGKHPPGKRNTVPGKLSLGNVWPGEVGPKVTLKGKFWTFTVCSTDPVPRRSKTRSGCSEV